MTTYVTADRVVSGETVRHDGAVRFGGDEILAAGPNIDPDASDSVYDLDGHTVLPGLVDGHVHITGTGLDASLDGPMESRYGTGVNRSDLVNASPAHRTVRTVENAKRTVEAGVTTVRDLGGPADVPMVVRDAVLNGDLVGPRILAAGEGISSTGGHGDVVPTHLAAVLNTDPGQIGAIGVVADGVAEVRRAVRQQVKKGADLVKVWTSAAATDAEGEVLPFSQEELDAVVEEAHRHGLDVAAHAQTAESVHASLDAGVDTVEHGMYVDEAAVERLAESNAYLTFTYATMHSLAERDVFPDRKNESARTALVHQHEHVPAIREHGVDVAMGSDAGSYALDNGANAEELVGMVDAGFDPAETLRIATHDTAAMLGLEDDVGLLEPGYCADIVAVEGNPLDDISVLADPDRITLVVARGEVVVDET